MAEYVRDVLGQWIQDHRWLAFLGAVTIGVALDALSKWAVDRNTEKKRND